MRMMSDAIIVSYVNKDGKLKFSKISFKQIAASMN